MSEASIMKYWENRYGKNEAIFFNEFIPSMYQQFKNDYLQHRLNEKLKYCPTIMFDNCELLELFPFWKLKNIKNVLNSLKEKGIISYGGNLKIFSYIIWREHETLVYEYMSFLEESHVQ